MSVAILFHLFINIGSLSGQCGHLNGHEMQFGRVFLLQLRTFDLSSHAGFHMLLKCEDKVSISQKDGYKNYC